MSAPQPDPRPRGLLSGARFWILIAAVVVLILAVGSVGAVVISQRLSASPVAAATATPATVTTPSSASSAAAASPSLTTKAAAGSTGTAPKAKAPSTPTPTAAPVGPAVITSFTVDPNVVTCDNHTPTNVGAVVDPAMSFSWSVSNLAPDERVVFTIGGWSATPDNSPADQTRQTTSAVTVPASGSRIESFLCADGDDTWLNSSWLLEVVQGPDIRTIKTVSITNAGDTHPWSALH